MNNRKYTIFSILFLFFLSALMMHRQLSSSYYYSCYISDTYQYTSWASQFIESLKEGVIYPRWLPLNFWGYGSPTFIIYPPLVFYVVALFNNFADSVIVAMNLAKFLSLFLSATGVFFLVRELYPDRIALITGSFSICLPMYISGFYIGGAFTSAFSLMWYPFILLFLYKYIRSTKSPYLIYAGTCYGGLILTHLINAYMFTFVIITFIFFMAISERKPKHLIGIPLILLIGIAISSVYFLPLIYEKQFISYHSIADNFPFSDYFVLPDRTGKFPTGFFWKASYNEILFHIILFFYVTVLILFLLIKSHLLRTKKNISEISWFFIGVSLFSLFLLFGPSIYIWNFIPFFKYINIPARWLNITAFAVVLLSASGFYILDSISLSKIKRYSVLAMIFVSFLFQDYKYVSLACQVDKSDLFPAKAINWLPEHLPIGVDTSALDKNGDLKEKVVITKGKGKANVVKWLSTERMIEIKAEKAVTLMIKTFNFPGWEAYIDGKQTETKTEEGSGAMIVDIQEGKHRLELRFMDTPIRYYSKIIFLVSLCMVIFLAFFIKKTDHG